MVQRATLNQQPSSSGTVTLSLPKATGAGDALIVGVSFWPLDLTSVTDSSGDSFTRGLTTSIYHNVSQGVMYTNFYYARSTAGGATSITLKFSGGSTYVVAAVAEVAGLDPSAPLDAAAYNESLSSTSPWSSAALTTATANEYLFSWAADEWTNPSCSNPASGWTATQNISDATLCVLDRTISAAGSYQAAVTPSAAFNYAMEIVAFKGASFVPPPLTISTLTLPTGTVGTAYSATLAATGGVSPYSWSASGLPSGLSISSAGTISGTPTTSGTFSASITVLDSTNAKVSASETIGVAAAPVAPPPPVSSSITVIQRATLNQQPSSSGTVTLALPKTSGAGDALIVGVSFWPLDVTSVTDSSGDSFTRGLTTSIYHNVSQGVMYTNFYYAKSTAGGATSITLKFSGGSTYVVAAVAEVAGLDPSAPLDAAAYNESLSSTSPWSSAALTTATANEYLFSWAADEWTNPSCSNPASGWTATQNISDATLCVLDRTISAAGSYQAAVTPSAAFNYAMEIVAFKGASTAQPPAPPSPPASPAPLTISTTTLPSGTVGTAYSATLAATGGVSPYTWSASGLPSGLSISSAATISGTPTASGTFSASITVLDSTNAKVSASETIGVAAAPTPPPPPVSSSITVIQRATLNQQPSSSGTVTLALPKTSGAGDALIVGVSFWPLDVTSVTDSSGDSFTRGLTTSIYHNVSQGVMYTNFYYAKSTVGGASSITLKFSGGSTYVVAAVAEVAGLDPSAPLDAAAYNESLSSTSPWSSAAISTATANEYLFSWAADEWSNPSCSNPSSGWTVTQNNSGATLCLLDRTISAAGSYQAAVTPSSAFNYGMAIVAFKGASSGTGSAPPSPPAPPAPLTISTTTLPAGTVGTAYSATLAATGGVSPYSWSASGLPNGLSISGVGTIGGTPTAAGTMNAAVTIQDSAGTTASASLPVAIGGASLPPRPAVTYNLLHFGNAGYGGDDTNVFQTALTYTAANAAALEIPAGSYNISPVTFRANSYLIVDANVTVSANPGYGSNAEMLNINSGPVTIIGAGSSTSIFQMPLAQAASIADGSQFRHCLEIGNGAAASNVTISGIACNQSGGDGIYIRNATNVTVENCLFNGNYRDGGSITGQVNGITLIGNYFTNSNGTLPKSGLDIEPNTPGDFLLNISLQNNYTDSNAGDGLEFELEGLTSASQPVSITVSGHHSDGNGRYGYVGLNNYPTNPGGTILVENSFSNGDGDFCAIGRFWQAGGTLLSFQNLTCTNPHVKGPDPSYGSSAAVGALRGGGASIPMGNISFTGTNISATNGMTTYYFDFEDGSGMGTSNVVFEPGTLSGATKAPPIGLLQGVGYSSIN